MTLVTLIKNPIDEIWMNQPERSKDPLMVHEVKFAGMILIYCYLFKMYYLIAKNVYLYLGKSWEEKLSELRDHLERKGYDAMVVTALDEIGWLFNLRGNDIPYNPFFRAYVVIDFDKVILYLPPEKQTQNVKDHLRTEVSKSQYSIAITMGYTIASLFLFEAPSSTFFLFSRIAMTSLVLKFEIMK